MTLLEPLIHRRPRGAVAFKFASPAKVSRVVSVLWTKLIDEQEIIKLVEQRRQESAS